MERTLKTPLAWLGQAVRFGAVGLLNTAIDLGLYFALTRWFGLGGLPVAAKCLSYSAGILNSFYWNKNWTFQARTKSWSALLPFALVNLAGLAVNAAVMQVCLKAMSLPEILSLGLATGCTLAWNFLASKFLVFRK
jgi:putative flippase GtrA